MGIQFEKLFSGKLEHSFLSQLLQRYTDRDEQVVVGSQAGEDATVIDGGDYFWVLKSDPITFVTEDVGYYVVHINANDIVCMGAEPRWFLSTILLPEHNATRKMVETIFSQISSVCRQEGIAFCGGHTEVTTGLDHPIVAGTLVGQVARDELLKSSDCREGDHVLLLRPVPIEGTAIIARERSDTVRKAFSDEFLKQSQDKLYHPGLSVRPLAQLAQATGRVRAMHDPTEGGVLTALYELALASKLGITVDGDAIPIIPEGKLLCDYFGLDPLGTLSSGSLLVVLPAAGVRTLLKACSEQNIPAADVAELTRDPQHVLIIENTKQKLPVFNRDEITKLF